MGEAETERIQRERQERRSAERRRMEEERHGRRREVTRLRLIDQGREEGAEVPAERPAPRLVVVPEEGASSPIPERATDPWSMPPDPQRAIGGTIHPSALEQFLRTDPTQRFDLLTLNTMRFTGLVSESVGDAKLIATIGHLAEALMGRVKREVDDPLSAVAFLRDQVLRWYRDSATDPEWVGRMTPRWAGIFSDTRVSGGRLQPWLNARLWALREEASRAGPLRRALRRGLLRDRPAESAAMRTASEQIHAEVAQAILDDLATHPHDPATARPLVRLSELAVRRQVQTVSDTLALLFNAPESGPFVILHPNRYPDCDELQIRPPVAGATGAALAYALVPGRPARKAGARLRAGTSTTAEGGSSADSEVPPGGEEEEVDGTTVWDADTLLPATWVRVVEERRRERRRLDPPPKDCRVRPAYASLRELVLERPEFRKAFLAAKWRGRPSGLPLLASLLQKGSLAPEVATDHEYLEAELGEIVQGDSQWHPEDGIWSFGDWVVTREGSHREGFRFKAERAG
ncbi:MAG: hypothetical protein ACREDE_01395 [Thermoplasmata archaeon]